MANSINVNVGAMVALQNLNASNRQLAVTQNRVSTGMTVSSAKDNGAIFAIATNKRAELASLDSVRQSMQRGQSIVDVALAAGDTVVEALTEMKALAVAIEAGGSAATLAALNGDYAAKQAEINAALAGAKFDGTNLWQAGAVTGVLTDTAGGTYDIGFATAVTATPAGATAAQVQATIEAFTASLATVGTQSKSLERYTTFNSKMQDAVEAGIGNLVDADLAKESARLTALQTKQQLGVQSLSIANSSSQILLSLFRS
jgi:flagellin